MYVRVNSLTRIFTAMPQPQFTSRERAFLLRNFHRTNSIQQTINLFIEQYPNSRVPSRNTVSRMFGNTKTTAPAQT